jgi:hypothetical protein
MSDIRKIETIAEPGNWLLLVSPQTTQLMRINDDDTVMVRGYERGKNFFVRLPQLSAFVEALSALWWDGAEEGLDEFRVP